MTRHTLKTTLELYGLNERGRSIKAETPQQTIDDQSMSTLTVPTAVIATITSARLLTLGSLFRIKFPQRVSIEHEGQETFRPPALWPRPLHATDRTL